MYTYTPIYLSMYPSVYLPKGGWPTSGLPEDPDHGTGGDRGDLGAGIAVRSHEHRRF